MSRSSRRAEAARMKAAAEKDFVHTAADRVGPLAQSAAERIGPLAEAAADAIGAAADKVSPLAHSAADRVGPLAQNAASRVGPIAQTAADKIAPLAGQAVERVGPYAKLAADRVSPYTQSAAGKIAPIAATARLRGSQVTEDARKRINPVLDDAVGRLGPVVGSARDKVGSDLFPRLSEMLGVVTAGSAVEEIAKDEPVVTKKKGRWVKRIAFISALGAVVVVLARRFLGSQDADWQAARPSTPYVPPTPPSSPAPTSTDTTTDAATDVGVTAEADAGPEVGDSTHLETAEVHGATALDQPGERGDGVAETAAGHEESVAVEEDFAAESAPMSLLNVTDSGDVEETVVDEVVVREPVADLPEGEPVNSSLAADEAAADERSARWSGEGVYVGHEPPEGFVIKGNERSMKYHMPEAAGYSRTIAEVWFNSEEAAQQAGFVRAQR